MIYKALLALIILNGFWLCFGVFYGTAIIIVLFASWGILQVSKNQNE